MVKKKISKNIRGLKHQARRHSIKEGIFASAKDAFGDRFIAPFAIAINASNSLVAMLTSIGGLLGPLSQVFSSRLIEKHSRKKIILTAILFRLLMWLALIMLAVLFYKGIWTTALPLMLLIFFAFYTIFVGVCNPAWFSWIGDIVDAKFRGRWFSKRNLIMGFVGGIFAVIGSLFLDYFKKNNWLMFGFIILFTLAFIFRLMSWFTFKKQYEPKIKLKKGYYFSFWDFLKKAPKNNFGKFTIFRAFLSFTCTISGALLAVYLLRYLKFDYLIYMIIIVVGGIFSFFVIELWGKFADKYGNYKVLSLTTVIIPIVPILWVLHPSPIYLILVPSLVSGISWVGFNLAASNFIYDNVHKQKRGLAISYHSMLCGIGVFLGAGLSALLIKYLKSTFIEPIIMIFIISAIARMIIVFWWIPKLKEIQKTQKFKGSKSIKKLLAKEGKHTLLQELHQMTSMGKYLH